MQGQGTFYDPRLNDADRFPIAEAAGFGDVRHDPDRVTGQLAGLHVYQLSLKAPNPPPGSFDRAAAARGMDVFNSEEKGNCARCHVPPLFTEPGWNTHKAEEIGIDDFQAKRSPDGTYRTAPLRALWDMKKIHKGGFYHDGRFPTLDAVVEHYNRHFDLRLTDKEKEELIEYLKSI